jgi:hypothetical protein
LGQKAEQGSSAFRYQSAKALSSIIAGGLDN